MWRVRILRVVVPALLVPFLILLALELRPRRGTVDLPSDADEPLVLAEGVELVSLEGARRLFDLKARKYFEPDAGHRKVEGVERLDVFRDDASPLRITADLADIRGEAPNRVAIVEGGLNVRDDEAGMELSLPTLEIREASREARSRGEVRFRAPGYDGTADEVVYPLDDRPTVFLGLELESALGDRMVANQARFLPGSEQIELADDVRFSNGPTWLESPAMTVRRDPDEGWIRAVDAGLGVRGVTARPGEPETSFRADRVEAAWSAPGVASRLALLGRAVLTQDGGRGLAASSLTAIRTDDADGLDGWDVAADGGVVARAMQDGKPATLSATTLIGRIDPRGVIVRGDAIGSIRFEHGASLATADRGTLRQVGDRQEVTLSGVNDAKARLSQAERRVAAETLKLRPGTRWLRAEGRTESTLLPATGRTDPGSAGLFRADTAIHFVSRSLETSASGDALVFEGSVRGWQGERNLSARTVRYDQASSSLTATGDVTTRFPLREGDALSESDYVQVTARELRYRQADGVAVYDGGVRVRQDLGWLECDALEARMKPDGAGVDTLVGTGNVELDYRTRDSAGMPRPVHGRGDRVRFDPAGQFVWLYGDERPAQVSTEGPGGGTTYGRVLRYGLADGSLEIEGSVTIRTGNGGGDDDDPDD